MSRHKWPGGVVNLVGTHVAVGAEVAVPRHLARRLLRRERKREFFIDNLLVRIHFIIVMIRWTGLAPWEFEFPFPGSLTSTFPVQRENPYSTYDVGP